MPSADIQLVCFDLGGVLIRICDSWPQACQLAGVPTPPAVANPAVLARLKQACDDHELGRCDAQQFARAVAALTALTPAQVLAVAAAWLRGPYAGVTEMIQRVASTSLRTACLSNTSTLHWAAMTDTTSRNYLPLDRLDHHFTSFTAGHLKPDAAMYAWVERQVDLAGPQILFFDDSPPNVQAARDRGWHSAAIDPTADPPRQLLDHLRGYGLL